MYASNIQKKTRKRTLVERLKTELQVGKVYNDLCVKNLQTAIKLIKAVENESNWALRPVGLDEADSILVWVGEGEPNEMAKATLLAIRRGADLAGEFSKALTEAGIAGQDKSPDGGEPVAVLPGGDTGESQGGQDHVQQDRTTPDDVHTPKPGRIRGTSCFTGEGDAEQHTDDVRGEAIHPPGGKYSEGKKERSENE